MNSPELNQQFFAALGGMELHADGIHEYEDVTEELASLQSDLIDHLTAVGGFDPTDELAAYDILKYLHEQIGKAFERLDRLRYDDAVIASGDAVVLTMDKDGHQDIELLGNDVRLHGKVVQPYALEVPLLESILDEEGEVDFSHDPVLQLSVAIEIRDATIETIDPDTEDGALEPLDQNLRVFLPITYPDLQIKRQV